MNKHSCYLALALTLATSAVASLSAQTSNGTIAGQVTDTAGAIIPRAQVVIVNTSTGSQITVQSTSAGVYSVPSLEPGTYELHISFAGFQTADITGVVVDASRTTTQNVKLGVGEVSSVVTVEAEDALLTKDSPSLQTTITGELAREIPLPERSALGLATLTPGVVGDPQYSNGVQSENPPVGTQPVTPGGSLSITGGRPGSSSVLVDGFDISLNGYARAGITFSADAIQQLTVQQNGLPAQYGRTSGGIINQATRSGGRDYHGTFRWRHQDPYFESATYGLAGIRRDFHQQIFEALVSGPVPHAGKTFFLGAYEPYRGFENQYGRRRVPTPGELGGFFGDATHGFSYDLLNATTLKTSGYAAAVAEQLRTGQQKLYYEYPLNAQNIPFGVKYASSNLAKVIANNDVSQQIGINPLAKYIIGKTPTPANPGPYVKFDFPDGSYSPDGLNAYTARGVTNTDNRFSGRVDHDFNNGDHLFGRFSYVPVVGSRYAYYGPTELDNIPTDSFVSQNAALQYTHILSGQKVNELRVSYLRVNRFRGPSAGLDKDYGAALGLLPATQGVGFPSINFSGSNNLQNIGLGGADADGGRSLDVNQGVADDFSFVRGRHAFKIGGEYRELQQDRLDNSNTLGGTYTFYSSDTSGPGTNGSALASLYLGVLGGSNSALQQQGFQPYYYRWNYLAGYIQDDWKALPNLTVNLGLRYQVETPRTEKYNEQGSFVSTITGTAGTGTSAGAATGAFCFSGSCGLGRGLWPTNFKSFEPRIGFDYSPHPRMTVRGSYALMHTPLSGLSGLIAPNLVQSASFAGQNVGTSLNNGYFLDILSNPAAPIPRIGGSQPAGGPLFTFSSSTSAPTLPLIQQTNAVPYVQLWSFSTQFAVTKSTVMEATYVGQHAVHLFSQPRDTNVASYNTVLADIQQHQNLSGFIYKNGYGLNGFTTLQQQQRPYQQFYNNSIQNAFDRFGDSNYNALYIDGNQRITHGLSVFASFSWSKSMDNSSNGNLDQSIVTDTYGFEHPQTPYNFNGEYSYSTFDQPVRTTAGYSYQLPFGHNKAFGSGTGTFKQLLIGGFSTSGNFSAQSGYPLFLTLGNPGYFVSTCPVGGNSTSCPGYSGTVTSATYTLGNNGSASIQNPSLRPNRIAGLPIINKNWKQDPYGTTTGGGYLLNCASPNVTCPFTVPGSLNNPTTGNLARTLGDVRNPRTIYFDASLRKDIKLYDKYHLRLDVDAINVLNHANFFMSGSDIGSRRNIFSSSVQTNYLNGLNGGAAAPYQYNGTFGTLSSGATTNGRVIGLGAQFSF